MLRLHQSGAYFLTLKFNKTAIVFEVLPILGNLSQRFYSTHFGLKCFAYFFAVLSLIGVYEVISRQEK